MENTVNKHEHNDPKITTQPLPGFDPEIERRVSGWFNSQRPLVWIPIISRQNFPDAPAHVLANAEQFQSQFRVPIAEASDLLSLPDNVTGWLLPDDEEDTDVACTVRNGEVYVLGVQDSRTGRRQTLLGELPDNRVIS
ncbi:MAG: hypothetical protein EBS37_07250 [Betaproteobacteria bacterium]|nr:hypothetical protein [Betaproteobacteria bacterium]